MYLLLIEGNVKPGKKHDFITAWSRDILCFGDTEPKHGVGLSIWKTREDGERYHREVFGRVASTVQHLMTGPPTVRPFHVESSATLRVAAHPPKGELLRLAFSISASPEGVWK